MYAIQYGMPYALYEYSFCLRPIDAVRVNIRYLGS